MLELENSAEDITGFGFRTWKSQAGTQPEEPCVLAGFPVPRGSIQAAEGQLLQTVLLCAVLLLPRMVYILVQQWYCYVCTHTVSHQDLHRQASPLSILSQDKILWHGGHRPQ